MEWNVTTNTGVTQTATNVNAATWSTSADSIVWTTAAPQSPTQMNAGAIEDYLVNVDRVAVWNPKGTPGGIDEALAGKPLDEQIKIINDLDRVVDNTNRNPNFIDAAWVQRDLQNQQQQAPAQPEWSQEWEKKWDESSLESRIAALEKAQQEKAQAIAEEEAAKNQKKKRVLSPDEKTSNANTGESMTKSMTYMMPIMTLFFTFTVVDWLPDV